MNILSYSDLNNICSFQHCYNIFQSNPPNISMILNTIICFSTLIFVASVAGLCLALGSYFWSWIVSGIQNYSTSPYSPWQTLPGTHYPHVGMRLKRGQQSNTRFQSASETQCHLSIWDFLQIISLHLFLGSFYQ